MKKHIVSILVVLVAMTSCSRGNQRVPVSEDASPVPESVAQNDVPAARADDPSNLAGSAEETVDPSSPETEAGGDGDGVEGSPEGGRLCADREGCGCTSSETGRFNMHSEILCSPGEKCVEENGCYWADADMDGVFRCGDEECACGSHVCSAGQICAYGDCYYHGKVVNRGGGCAFDSEISVCGTSDPGFEHVSYRCPGCLSEKKPEPADGYERRAFEIGDDCQRYEAELWVCLNPKGCACGGVTCPENTACVDGRCALGMLKEEREFGDPIDLCPDRLLMFQPARRDGYVISVREERWSYDKVFVWGCREGARCICNGQALPEGAYCDARADGSERAGCDYSDAWWKRTPKQLDHFVCRDKDWVCPDGKCLCGGRRMPVDSFCRFRGGEEIFCRHLAPKETDGYACRQGDWVCIGERCACGGDVLSEGASCLVDGDREEIRCADKALSGSATTDYRCADGRWECISPPCRCQGRELPLETRCGDGKAFCGDDYLSDWEGYACVNAGPARCENGCPCVKYEWRCASGACLCHGKPLPEGAGCRNDMAVCGGLNPIDDWDGYACDQKRGWVCASEACRCHGKAIPKDASCRDEGAFCGYKIDNPDGYACEKRGDARRWQCVREQGCACGDVTIPAGSGCMRKYFEYASCGEHGMSDPKGYRCDDGSWACASESCKCNDRVIHRDDVCSGTFGSYCERMVIVDRETCDHVRGCLCHGELCPVTGRCSAEGCVDPLTGKNFSRENGYLVSGLLRQCADKAGCACGEERLPYGEYCFGGYHVESVYSYVQNGKRAVFENNFLECGDGTDWINDGRWKAEGVDFAMYLMRDCLKSNAPTYFSDRSYSHDYQAVCGLEAGCPCGGAKCGPGERCDGGECKNLGDCTDLSDFVVPVDEKTGRCCDAE